MSEAVSVGILGLGAGIPEGVITNADLEKIVDTSDEWIRTRSGIRERRIAGPEIATSDLAYEAASAALADAGLSGADLDLIIVATITPDYAFPSTSCLIQHRLGAERAAAYDLSAGCSGFIYALAQATQAIAAGIHRHVLVVGAETLSKITDWTDRSTCVLFGDGAGAAVLGPVPEGRGFLAHYLGSDGGGGKYLNLPGGGSRQPASHATVANKEHFIKMNGNEVFKFAVRIMPEAAEEVLRRAGLGKDEIDLFVPHQANIRIMEAAAKRLDLPMEKVYVNVDRYGNTSAASIPIALWELSRAGRLHPGDRLLLVGFGAGVTWGASVLVWSKSEGGATA
ncbi:MAG: beta-ketoacyl-ACP synthase III [Patescibacteria group bacterium]